MTRRLAKQICQLATLEHFTRLEQLMADQHSVHIGHDDMLQVVLQFGITLSVSQIQSGLNSLALQMPHIHNWRAACRINIDTRILPPRVAKIDPFRRITDAHD